MAIDYHADLDLEFRSGSELITASESASIRVSADDDRRNGRLLLGLGVFTAIALTLVSPRDREMAFGVVVAILLSVLGIPAGYNLRAWRNKAQYSNRISRITIVPAIGLFFLLATLAFFVARVLERQLNLGFRVDAFVLWAEAGALLYLGLMYSVASRRRHGRRSTNVPQ